MKVLPLVSQTLLCLFALSSTTLVSTALSPAVPDSLEPPGDQSLSLTLTGRGVQIYNCSALPNAPNKFGWILKAPEADLFDSEGHKVGRHFAGPTWELNNGGKVIGRVKAKADAPDGKGIPWLLLDAVQSDAIMGKVQSIQRVNTVGGQAPADPIDATDLGKEKRVDYSATYKFFVAAPSHP